MRLLALLIFLTALSPAAFGAEAARSAHTEVELVSEPLSIQPGTPFWAALRMKMDEHWHTYWRNPGDSGIATEIRWQLPEGFKADEILWPAPKKIDLPPLAVYAYEGEVFLLTRITPPAALEAGSVQTLKAQVYWLECEVNCIPGDALLSMSLPVKMETPAADPRWVEAFARTRAALPLDSSAWNVRAESGSRYFRFFLSHPDASQKLEGVTFFPYDDKLIQHPSPQTFRAASGGYELFVERSTLAKNVPDQLKGMLVSRSGWRGPGSEPSLEISAPAPQADDRLWRPSSADERLAVLGALLFAFAGGLLLNLMPCVFPVISLKILHFVENARDSRARLLTQGGVFTLGVFVSFWTLAGVLLALRSAGQEVGWGFQLQTPGVVVFLAGLFFVLALNLFGFFEIGLSLTAAGSGAVRSGGLGGVFLNGVLATVVATPCTAPFMGSALGYAVTRPAAEALLVFTGLGAGMAAPYLVLSAFPQWIQLLPKPGAWMEKLKKLFGFFLLLTAFWLAWVLDLQAGRAALAALGAGWMFLWAAAVLYGRRQKTGSGAPLTVVLLLALLGAAGPVAALKFLAGSPPAGVREPEGVWQKFSQTRFDELRNAGEPVFVDFTAAWCLTCQVNKRTALNVPEIQEKFSRFGVTLLKADWTSRDPEITRALAQYGRSSVPFYVLYGKGRGAEPVFLPELLTPAIVSESIEKVFGKGELE